MEKDIYLVDQTQIINLNEEILRKYNPNDFIKIIIKKYPELNINYIFLLYYRYYYIYNILIFKNDEELFNNIAIEYDKFVKNFDNKHIKYKINKDYYYGKISYYNINFYKNENNKNNFNEILKNTNNILKIIKENSFNTEKEIQYFNKYLLFLNIILYFTKIKYICLDNNNAILFYIKNFKKYYNMINI